MLLDFIFFALRYAPWWTVPVIMISSRFAYIWWLKENRIVAIGCGGLIGLSSIVLIYYIWAGSPSQAVYYFREIMHGIVN